MVWGISFQDEARVRKRFLDSELYGIEVEECQLSINNVLQLLLNTGPLIVLVNANLLTCNDCSWKLLRVCTKICCLKYQGHFILVLGYDLSRGLIHYRNPGNPDGKFLLLLKSFLHLLTSSQTQNVLMNMYLICILRNMYHINRRF